MSHLMCYTDEEKQAIEKLKKLTFHDLTPTLQKDETLYYRFLKARDFNLKKAEALLRKHLSDRKIYDVERILKHYDPPNKLNEYWPSSFVGFGKEGHVVRYTDVGGLDFEGLMSSYDFKELYQFMTHYIENDMNLLMEQSKKLGKPITTVITILNLDKLTLSQATNKKGLDFQNKAANLNQDNYPERIKAMYIINASIYFHMAFALTKNFMATELLRKMHVFGKTGWQEALLNVIDADVLPAFLGGNRTDPDGNPLCNSFIVHGKKVPEELYKNKKRQPMNAKDVKTVTIHRSSSHEIKLTVDNPDTQIEWEFETKSGDIGFALLFKDVSAKDEKLDELIPNHRVDTELSSEVGVYPCSKTGTYIIVFDNSYSWLHSKEVSYRICQNKIQDTNLKQN